MALGVVQRKVSVSLLCVVFRLHTAPLFHKEGGGGVRVYFSATQTQHKYVSKSRLHSLHPRYLYWQ